ncbi:hypothetical protein L6164_004158 [Bauhinia variegata]|uniref:Uncharacterized protein n=1 Tax=Bauhinia variegata TaxID=167791 RepID=A0ACB9Q3K7_BAUVA|nr:hypothetical protein L6164_004158 [Bauhinia variegata]
METHVYRKVVAELDQVVVKYRFVEDSDIANLHYFQAVIKAVLRLHPAVPLLVPRPTNEACQIQGYNVSKHCIVYVNVWGMGRDPKVWDNPLEFKPERFIGSSIDVLGQNYNLLPLGAGRRYCAGMLLGHRMVHLYVASLLHAFERDFPREVLKDSSEIGGIALKKTLRLVGTAKPRLAESLYRK